MPKPGDGTYVNTSQRRGGKPSRYLRISSGPQRDKYVHQLVAEAMLGRELAPNEDVDHKDEDTLNNDWRNLQVLDKSEHARLTRERENGTENATEQTEGTDNAE
jgi:hypothetical protein